MDRNHIKRFVVTDNEDHVTGIVSRPERPAVHRQGRQLTRIKAGCTIDEAPEDITGQ